MAEERIFFMSQGCQLEGLLETRPGAYGAVIAHPHPLYGGEMRNPVVGAVQAAYAQAGYTTLRFNFRGVGTSEGTYDEGRGEQTDVTSALQVLHERGKGVVDLAGYSFGAWVIALGLDRFTSARRAVFVSPPVALIDFSFFSYSPKLALVVAGSLDEIAPAEWIQSMCPQWNPDAELAVIPGADHFFDGKTESLVTAVGTFLKNAP